MLKTIAPRRIARTVAAAGGLFACLPALSAAQLGGPDTNRQRQQPIVRTFHVEPRPAPVAPDHFHHPRPYFGVSGYFYGGYCPPGYYGGGYLPYYAGPSVYLGFGNGAYGYGNYAVPEVYAPSVTYNYNAVPPAELPDIYRQPQMNLPPANPPSQSTGTTRGSDEDYYLNRRSPTKSQVPSALRKDPSLAQAVADIEKAFRTGDIEPLAKHIAVSGPLTVQSQGRERHKIAASDYLDMTRDAFKNMTTVSYKLDQVEPASNGGWLAYGTHVLKVEDGSEKTFNVGFVLTKKDDNWIITEVSGDPAK